MKLLPLILIFNFFISSYSYNMLWSVCKAVFTTMLTDFQYLSVRPIRPIITNNSYVDVSLIILKGSNIKSHHYVGISKTIQKIGLEKGLNIDIKIPHFPYIQNFDNDIKIPLFALGHSSGAYDFLLYHNITNYDGFIQVGSVLNSNGKLPWKSRKLEEFPIPVMSLIGKKDGYLRHTYCLDEMYTQNETEKYKTKPIIIMNNITHLHISNTSSSNIANIIGLKDLKSTMHIQTAWSMLGLCIVDFIILNMNNSSLHNRASSLERMRRIQSETQTILTYYLKFDNTDNLKKLLSILYMFLNYQYNIPHNSVYLLDFYKFLLSKPTDNTTYFYKEERKFLSKMYFTPLWVKTKYKLYLSASTINKYIFQQISSNYHYDTKIKIVFRPDIVCSTTLEWILTNVKIERKNDTLYVQSPIFITDNSSIVYKNFYYLKILSLAQIQELINIDLQDY